MIKVIINQEGKNTRERPREIPVQNNAGNEHSNNLIIANITSQLKRVKVPTYVVLQWYGGFILIEAILIKEYTYI